LTTNNISFAKELTALKVIIIVV